jgi:putative intracellular protease/amidase/alkylhydroperoxidase/carboxymuconolactone decarboxylase family protein YurZ
MENILAESVKPVLCVVTSHPIKGDTGVATGFWLSELTHPLAVLHDAGIPTELASVRGGQPPVDGFDLSDDVNARFWKDSAFRSALSNSLSLVDVDASRYSAVFFAGGHGTMWDFADSPAAQRVIREIYEAGGVVAAVCHGPAALVNAKRSDGSYLVSGKRVAAFTDEEEAEVQATNVVPFLLASTLKRHGAMHQAAPNWSVNVVVDGRLVTGQNPASAHGVGEAVRDLVKAAAVPRRSALSREEIASVAPVLAHYTRSRIVQDLWHRPELSKKDRYVATIATFIARGQTIGMLHYFNNALDADLTPAELSELVTHMAFYAGWPNAFSAVDVLKDIFTQRGIGADQLPNIAPKLLSLAEAVPDEAIRVGFIAENIGPVSAALQHYTDELLYHEVWLRPGLEPRLRNLATITALIATGNTQFLPSYLNRAVEKGITRAQVAELLAHVAFYAGWPVAIGGAGVVKQFFDAR